MRAPIEDYGQELVECLRHPEAYPRDPSAPAGIEWIQTHISHVFLTRDRVYKLRKPVDPGFLSFATRTDRNRDCVRELELNRRLAPGVYLGAAKIERRGSAFVLGGTLPCPRVLAEDGEHCVVMRRLPRGHDALSLLDEGELTPAHVDRIAARIARFHDGVGLGRPSPFTPEAWRARILKPIEANFAGVAEAGTTADEGVLRALQDRARAEARRLAPDFERRRLAGRAVDGHGDLHLDHVWFPELDGDPIAIDCIEFSEDLRRIDAASEVAFLAMDLEYRGHPDFSDRFLATYARDADDFDLYSVVDFFQSYRAAVRAKVAAMAAIDLAVPQLQRDRAATSSARHLDLAARMLGARTPGALILVGGVVGTGKSTAARLLSEATGAVVIASDRVRKRQLGLAPTERANAPYREGAYSEEQTERVYEGLLERARPVLASGRNAILDATFARARHRSGARALAGALGTRAFFFETSCAREVALRRLGLRQAQGGDPSDAGPELHARSAAAFEPLDEWPQSQRATLETDRDDWTRGVESVARKLELGRRLDRNGGEA